MEDLVRCLDDLSIVTANCQQRSREQGELMPGDCAGPLKKGKRMVISAPSARGKDLSQQSLHDVVSPRTYWPWDDAVADRAYKRKKKRMKSRLATT